MSGQMVATLANGEYPAGNHSVVWKGKTHKGQAAKPGIYLCKLQFGNNIQTKKMRLE